MANKSRLILVDSTILIRLALGEEGVEFATNLFSRAERRSEELVIPSIALYEAIEKVLIALTSKETGATTVPDAIKLLRDETIRSRTYTDLEKFVSYFFYLHSTGRIMIYGVQADDVEQGIKIAIKYNLPLNDALTLAVAEKLRIQKIATFSEKLRRISGYQYLPP